ncbi:hypothetical protein M9H77_26118 [Catharanthus roseus]|uniref:Uncharacterized protein n=1 Tax=Catharanthus roseus TaxID=4058 RepID=A0ACC0A8V8_CATRO|nr:hypothetical protein M9H77_26118 [Catharanthus roseus]
MDSEMRSLTDLLHQISIGSISKVREMRRLVNPVFPKDPGVTLTSPPEVAVTKGRKKTDSTKRDKSQADLFLVLALDLGRCLVRVLGRDLVGEGDHHELLGKGAEDATVAENNVIGDGNCGYRAMADFVFGDEHQWPKVCTRILYKLEHSMNLYVNLVGSEECVNELVHRIHWLVYGLALYAYWFKTPNSLHIIANAFNLCVILIAQLGSTTVLPLYSYSDRPEELQLNDMCLIPPLHVQWIHRRSEWVSNWADSYQH